MIRGLIFALLVVSSSFAVDDDDDCPLTSQTLVPWLVHIVNTSTEERATYGNILTSTAILTTCYEYVGFGKDGKWPDWSKTLKIVAIRMKNVTNYDMTAKGKNLCSSVRKANQFYRHPRCSGQELPQVDGKPWTYDWRFYDIGIFSTNRPFLAEITYPTMPYPNTPREVLYLVEMVNQVENSSCQIPSFYPTKRNEPPQIQTENTVYRSVRYSVKCIAYLCEPEPSSPKSTREAFLQKSKECVQELENRQNMTTLCMHNEKMAKLSLPNVDPPKRDSVVYREHLALTARFPLRGSCLICHGVSLGIVTFGKARATYSRESWNKDFYVIHTWLRTWRWITEMKTSFSKDWIEKQYVEQYVRKAHTRPYSRPPFEEDLPIMPYVEPPKDNLNEPQKNCSLNSNSLFAWVVKIFDTHVKIVQGHGVILSTMGVLTVCSPAFQHLDTVNKSYEIYGNKIRNEIDLNTCFQKNIPLDVYPHPRAADNLPGKKVECRCKATDELNQATNEFCFLAWKLERPFRVFSPFLYPAIYLPSDVAELLDSILFIDYFEEAACRLPYFRTDELPDTATFKRSAVERIVESENFQKKCISKYCHEVKDWYEEEGIDGGEVGRCIKQQNATYGNGEELCFHQSWGNTIPSQGFHNYEWFYTGTPLVCNGTTFGMVKADGTRLVGAGQPDWFKVGTFLRVWPWLIGMKSTLGAPWIKPHFIEEMHLVPEFVPEPGTVRLPGEPDPVSPDSIYEFLPVSVASTKVLTIPELLVSLFILFV